MEATDIQGVVHGTLAVGAGCYGVVTTSQHMSRWQA